MGTNTNTKEIEELISLKPCKEGLAFAKSFPSLADAWEVCENSSWMWWYLQKSEKATKELSVEYAQKCAKHVEHFNNIASNTRATRAAFDAAYASFAADFATRAAVYATRAADYATSAATSAAISAAASDVAVYAAGFNASTFASAAASAVASAAASADEYKWQADLLRTLISNPIQSNFTLEQK
jgi:hypothetical protein